MPNQNNKMLKRSSELKCDFLLGHHFVTFILFIVILSILNLKVLIIAAFPVFVAICKLHERMWTESFEHVPSCDVLAKLRQSHNGAEA